MRNDLYPAKVQKVVSTLLTDPAVCPQQLRQAIEAYAAALGGAARASAEIPSDLTAYVTKVALYAYKMTDADIQQLTGAGYSDDEVFEITLCAALGASLARLECAYAALKGEPSCAQPCSNTATGPSKNCS